jgi:1-deoxy-D-xylulose-5-phosphate reductoisomerase
MVVAGPLIMGLAKQHNATLVPVDSEHSAVFQALHAGQHQDLERIVLTASGGPFLDLSISELQNITLEQALQHPTWDMGPKITIDSATMLNKALEIVEARWLFELKPDQIEVVIHPQSVIHSMVEFRDGSVIAQLSPPDMKLPIQYALTYPNRTRGLAERIDWNRLHELTFQPPDLDRFPALSLGHEVAARGGTCGAVLNAAKEESVQLFINGKLSFHEIVSVCRDVLNNHTFDPSPSLDELMQADTWARQEVDRWTMAS